MVYVDDIIVIGKWFNGEWTIKREASCLVWNQRSKTSTLLSRDGNGKEKEWNISFLKKIYSRSLEGNRDSMM